MAKGKANKIRIRSSEDDVLKAFLAIPPPRKKAAAKKKRAKKK